MRIQQEIDNILDRNLGDKTGVISFIPDGKLQNVAERAIWLGNDDVHYTGKWSAKDIQDLKAIAETACAASLTVMCEN